MKSLLSPKDLALALGVSESSLKRWADEGKIKVARTAGGHRKILLSEAVRFVRETSLSVLRPDLLGVPELVEVHQQLSHPPAINDAIHDALLVGDFVRFRAMTFDLYLTGKSCAQIFDGPVKDAMHRIGERWMHGPEGIYHEHRATDVCVQALNMLRSVIPQPEPDAPQALGGAPSSDPYLIPSLMSAIVLAEAGYNVTNLGPDTPIDVLITAAHHKKPRIVWLSLSITNPAPPSAAQINQFVQHLATINATLVVGGRGASALGLQRHPNLHFAETMGELFSFGKGMLK